MYLDLTVRRNNSLFWALHWKNMFNLNPYCKEVGNSIVPLIKRRKYISMLPNFSPQISFLAGEFWAFLTDNFTVFPPDFMQKSEYFCTKIAQAHFIKKLNFFRKFCNFGIE